MQLIVIDPFVSDAVRQVCTEVEDVIYLPLENADMIVAYQEGFLRANGTFVNFTLASSSYAAHAYRDVGKAFAKYQTDLVALRAFFVGANGEQKAYGGSCKAREKMEQIDLTEEPHRFQLLLQAYFFRRKLLKNHAFRSELHGDALYQFLLEVLLEQPVYVYLRCAEYHFTVALEDNTSLNPLQYCRWWYHNSVTDFLTPLLKQVKEERGRIPEFLQAACYYLIYSKFNCNYNDRTKGILKTKEESMRFLHEVFQLTTFLDNTVLMDRDITSFTQANRAIRMLLLQGKAEVLNKDLKVVDVNHNFVALMEPKDGVQDDDYENHAAVLTRNNRELLRIRVMNYENGMLHIDANVGVVDFLRADEYEVFARCTLSDGKTMTYPAERVEVYPLVKCFGITFQRKHSVQFHIPVSDDPKQRINFYYRFSGRVYQFKLTFNIYNSRMTPLSEYSYWVFREGWMATWYKKETLILRKYSGLFHFKRELLFARDLYLQTDDKQVRRRGLLLRLLYWLTRSHYSKKHIWVTFDKQYKAGDNGEYMYHYCRENHSDEVEIYYTLRKEAPDYPRLVKENKKHILVYGTLRCQLISLMAEVLLATHANIAAQYNPEPDYNTFTKDLQRGSIVCIQHGLTIQKIAQYQNRVFDNTRLYCCASPYEIKNLSHPFYGYEPETLKLVGLARYDGLKSRDQKIILISPSWRRNVVNSSVANIRKTHNDNFKGSSYFRIYNTLINDQTLIDCAKSCGYRIVYLLHPAMSAQIDDFDRNDYVELVPATGDVSYEKILCESSLMVTDYSGVQFDFAYMRKPLVYYHPAELPPHYDEGGLVYSTMGFGPICTNHQEIVTTLCEAMRRGCQMEPEYIRRADDFFAYDDHNNCQRIYNEVRRWQEQNH
ncbi:MAG: CDP-glycerol glycerophosphotransferase family protein [Clostridiales bacterium]|nr:CDP-glycerol glycerophosphotransferase family protein [Clostridiales bacterium]